MARNKVGRTNRTRPTPPKPFRIAKKQTEAKTSPISFSEDRNDTPAMEPIPVPEEAHATSLARGGRARVPRLAVRPPFPARLRPRRPHLQQVPGACAPLALAVRLLHGAAARAAPAGAAAPAGGARHAPGPRDSRLHRTRRLRPRPPTDGRRAPLRSTGYTSSRRRRRHPTIHAHCTFRQRSTDRFVFF